MANIDNSCDVIDLRDVTERFEEMESEREDLVAALAEATEREATLEEEATLTPTETSESRNDLADWDEDNGEEFKAITELLEELKGSGGDHQWRGDWYPGSLIRDSYFVEAMQDLVTDIGDLPKDIPGYLAIDWEKTAENLKVDYSSVEYSGITYYYR